jgi:ADP-ribosylglycohydrolase
MNKDQITRARHGVLGALVADSATMGFHWLYSQRRIQDLAPSEPEFRTPNESDYADNVGYFAHPKKNTGELSHYGEQSKIMLKSLVANGNRYEKHHYQEAFRDHFGYGGEFRGYIDKPTRLTLDKIYRTESDALARTNEIPFAGEDREKQVLLTKVLSAAKRFQGEQLASATAQLAEASSNPADAANYISALVQALAGSSDFPGADDEQLPAISKLPALVACHFDDADMMDLSESAIRVTNNADRAIDFGRLATTLVASAISGVPIADSIALALESGSTKIQKFLQTVLAENGDLLEVTKKYGLHCDLGSGTASMLFNLKSAQSYTDTVRDNIYAGGDNCGRSIVLGAVAGATFGIGGDNGIPESWITQTHDYEQINQLIDQLLPLPD